MSRDTVREYFAITDFPDSVSPQPTRPLLSHGEIAIGIRPSRDTKGVNKPGACSTRIRGVDARSNLVGDYLDSSMVTHGFIACRLDR